MENSDGTAQSPAILKLDHYHRTAHYVGVSLLLDAYRRVNEQRQLAERLGQPLTVAAAFAVVLVNVWMKKNHPKDECLFVVICTKVR